MAVTIDKIISSITPPANKAVAWYNPLTGKLYINNGSWIGIKAEDEGGGGGATGIRVGYVNEHSTGFPTTRPDGSALVMEDYVSVSADATVPFTLGSITFTSKRDTGVWSGSQWVLAAGAIIESKEIISATSESLSGTATRQNVINEEVVSKVGQETLDVDSKTNITLAVNYIWQELQKAGYTFNITETDNDSVRNFKITIKDYNNQVIYEKTLSDFILKTREIAGIDLVDDITDQELEEALKEIEVEYKNKTIDADYNTIKELQTNNFKESALAKSTKTVVNYENSVDTKLVTEKFLQKTLQNIFTPENDADATNKKYVDDLVEELAGKVMKFKGFISEEEPTGLIKEGTYWYADVILPDTFPINVKTYNATTKTWSSDTVEYSPNTLDLWSCLNDGRGYYWFGNDWNLIDENVFVDDVMIGKNNEGELTFKEKTSADEDKVWKVLANGKWGLKHINEWLIVDTFVGQTPSEYTLYILTQDVTISDVEYKKGFYTWTELGGYQLRSGSSEVFIDCEELPTTNITDQSIYRLHSFIYKHNDTEIEEPNGYKFADGSGYLCTIDGIYLEGEEGEEPTLVALWENVNTELIADLLTQGLETADYEDAQFFKYVVLLSEQYDIASNFAREDKYQLYHNPKKAVGQFVEIGAGEQVIVDDVTIVKNTQGQLEVKDEGITNDKLDDDIKIGSLVNVKTNENETVVGAINELGYVDVTTLPSSNISKYSTYRLKVKIYYHGEDLLLEQPVSYAVLDTDYCQVSSEGLTIDSVLTLWEELTAEVVNGLINDNKLEVVDFDSAEFCKYGDNYDIATNFSVEDTFELYQNPTETIGGFIQIGGGDVAVDDVTIQKSFGKLKANAILYVQALPTVNIIPNAFYRIIETAPIRMVKTFTYENGTWINHSRVYISKGNYDLLTEAQKNDGTIYIVDSLSELIVQFTYTTIADKPKINGITLNGALSLEDLSLYSRNEVDAMLANKGTAEFVNAVPATTVALTWYYSKKFIDGTDVPNDKRALYITDKDNVLNYMGVVGDVDLSNYYMKSEVDTLLAAKVDTAGDGLSKTGTTLKINNSITANTTNGLKSFAVDKNGLVTAYTTKSLGRGLNESSNVIGHSNSITAPTGKRIIQGTYDAQGHLTAIETEFNWSNNYFNSAENQLFTRKGANDMYVNYLKSTNGTLTKNSVVTNDYSHYVKCGNIYQLSIGFQNSSEIAKDALLYTLPETISSGSIEMYIVISTVDGNTRVLQCGGGSSSGKQIKAKSSIPSGYWFGSAIFIKV